MDGQDCQILFSIKEHVCAFKMLRMSSRVTRLKRHQGGVVLNYALLLLLLLTLKVSR